MNPLNKKTKVERANLVYKGQRLDSMTIEHPHDIQRAVLAWFYRLRPALKRGETVTLELELVGE